MVDEDKLSSVLSEFARTLLTDLPIQGILDHLVERMVDVVPITGAGVTLITDDTSPHAISASDATAMRFEQLQSDLREGPCLVAHRTGQAVQVGDLPNDDRFPRFGPAAVAAGLAAVFTFPLRHGEASLGALDLYRDTVGDLGEGDLAAAQTLADVAAAYLLNARVREEVRAESDLFRTIAMHDPLTGLPNRLLLRERLERAASRSRRSHAAAAILYADLDRFKEVNDAHGHVVGDELLRAVAERLAGLVRPGDTLARVSGDEFVFLCEDLHSPDDAHLVAERIHEAFAEPFHLTGTTVAMSASVGVAFTGPGEAVSDDLVVRADRAMYAAKQHQPGGAQAAVVPGPAQRARHGDGAASDLRAAFSRDELEVAYQPIVRAVDGSITGVEALLRWSDPARGPQPTLAMVRVAEESGLIVEVGAWVLEQACRDRAAWLVQHPAAPLDVAVNVSVAQLMTADLLPTVSSILRRTGTDPTAVVLEVTEHSFIEDSVRAMASLRTLKGLGVRLALDDFGTGYASLGYLLRLPLDIVKLDRGFIVDVDAVPTSAAVLAAVTNLAHVLGFTVIAEGVETQRQHDLVTAVGCEAAQGFLYARPMPAHELGAWLGRGGTSDHRTGAPTAPAAPDGREPARPGRPLL